MELKKKTARAGSEGGKGGGRSDVGRFIVLATKENLVDRLKTTKPKAKYPAVASQLENKC